MTTKKFDFERFLVNLQKLDESEKLRVDGVATGLLMARENPIREEPERADSRCTNKSA